MRAEDQAGCEERQDETESENLCRELTVRNVRTVICTLSFGRHVRVLGRGEARGGRGLRDVKQKIEEGGGRVGAPRVS